MCDIRECNCCHNHRTIGSCIHGYPLTMPSQCPTCNPIKPIVLSDETLEAIKKAIEASGNHGTDKKEEPCSPV